MSTVFRKPFRRADSTSDRDQFSISEATPAPILSPGLNANQNCEDGGTASMTQSEQKLAELGYKQEFKREMSLLGVVGMSLTA